LRRLKKVEAGASAELGIGMRVPGNGINWLRSDCPNNWLSVGYTMPVIWYTVGNTNPFNNNPTVLNTPPNNPTTVARTFPRSAESAIKTPLTVAKTVARTAARAGTNPPRTCWNTWLNMMLMLVNTARLMRAGMLATPAAVRAARKFGAVLTSRTALATAETGPMALKQESRAVTYASALAVMMFASDGLTLISALSLTAMLTTLRRETEAATLATTSAEVAPLMTSMTGEANPERTETSTVASRFKRDARNS